jgi:hypothetical protein
MCRLFFLKKFYMKIVDQLNVEIPALSLVAGMGALACFSKDPIISGLGAIAHATSISHLVLKKSVPWPFARKILASGISCVGVVLNPKVTVTIGLLVGMNEAMKACRRRCRGEVEEEGHIQSCALIFRKIEESFGDRLVSANFYLAKIRGIEIIEISSAEVAAVGVSLVSCLSVTPFLAATGAAVYPFALSNVMLKKKIPSGLLRGAVSAAISSGLYLSSFSPFTIALLGLGVGAAGLGSRLYRVFRCPQSN